MKHLYTWQCALTSLNKQFQFFGHSSSFEVLTTGQVQVATEGKFVLFNDATGTH